MKYLTLERGDSCVRADLSRPIDISIPLDFAGPQPSHFGAPAATANAMRSGDFVGDVRLAPFVADAAPSRPLLFPLVAP